MSTSTLKNPCFAFIFTFFLSATALNATKSQTGISGATINDLCKLFESDKTELDKNLDIIETTFNQIESFITKPSEPEILSMDNQDHRELVSDLAIYFSGLKAAQNSLVHRKKLLINKDKVKLILACISLGVFIEEQCELFIPFADRHNILESEQKESFSQALRIVKDISARFYQKAYPNDFKKSKKHTKKRPFSDQINNTKKHKQNRK